MTQEFVPATLDDRDLLSDGDTADVVRILQGMNSNQYWRKVYPINRGNPSVMEAYVKNLQRAGLDVGKGDATFGYRMPSPERGAGTRYLVIFRRR